MSHHAVARGEFAKLSAGSSLPIRCATPGMALVRFSAPEFTVLCAVTGKPDFAHIMIDYVPKGWIIESKAPKFFLASFRSGNHDRYWQLFLSLSIRASAAIGISVTAHQSMCSGLRENCQKTSSSQTKG